MSKKFTIEMHDTYRSTNLSSKDIYYLVKDESCRSLCTSEVHRIRLSNQIHGNQKYFLVSSFTNNFKNTQVKKKSGT